MIIFADTFAFIAWLNPRDADHSVVSDYLEGYRGRLVTTEWVLVELADALSAPAWRGIVVEFLQLARVDPLFEIVAYNHEVYERGFQLFASRPDKSWSLTDCISFSVMQENGITEALTADHHFEQAGFRPIFR